MIRFNVPLSQWRTFDRPHQGAGFFDERKLDKTAQDIYRQLSHDEAVTLVAKEFESLPPTLRLLLRDLCNKGNASGNVRKGVQRLDRLMHGKLLREETHEQIFQAKTRDGWKSKTVNPAVAGATRKYGIVKK
jgi:hypothetical protein